ncbi:MAG: alpha/beta fold hydrolase [Bowdeniella nasicola]|nr:alpha/beta fold hydrolase [Bowdeniella nasicola]
MTDSLLERAHARGRRLLRRRRPLHLHPSLAGRDNPLDRLSVELVRSGKTWVRVYRKAYSAPGTTPGDRFPGIPHRRHHTERPAQHPERPTFVLIHGIGVSSRYFTHLAEDLAELGDVFLLDLPGFANLPQPKDALSIAGFAAVVHEVLTAHGVVSPVILGHSMGAQVVTEILARRPGFARAAILVGPPVNDAEGSVAMQALRFMQSSVHESRGLRLIAIRAYLQCGLAWFLDVLPEMMRYPIRERLTHVSDPVVFVRGEFDYVAPTAWLKRLGARTPHIITGAAHSVIYAHDGELFSLISKVLPSLAAARAEDE